MDDAHPMEVLQRGNKLSGNGAEDALGESAAIFNNAEKITASKLGNNADVGRGVYNVERLHNVWVINFSEDFHLATKSNEIVGGLLLFVDDFDGNHPAREFTTCFVDSAKRAFADLLDEVIVVHLDGIVM
jgi:hypothetical protein